MKTKQNWKVNIWRWFCAVAKQALGSQLIFAVLPACCLGTSVGVNSASSVELWACQDCCVCSFKVTRFVDFMDGWDYCEVPFPFV